MVAVRILAVRRIGAVDFGFFGCNRVLNSFARGAPACTGGKSLSIFPRGIFAGRND